MGFVVDAHHHFWDPTRASYPWMTDAFARLRRPFGPADLRPLLDFGIDRTVLVQTRSSLAETREFLATAAAHDFIGGVVGWVDLTAPDVAEQLAELRTEPGGAKLVGIRHQVHDEADPEWLLRTDVQRGIAAVGNADLAYDLLVRTRELPAALATVRAHPNVRFVVDHLAKPPIASGEIDQWAEHMAPMATAPNVMCKISGMVTEADWRKWSVKDLRPYMERVFGWFGLARCVFGSDWPVHLVAATYKEVLMSTQCTVRLSNPELALLFGGSAAELYRLPVPATLRRP